MSAIPIEVLKERFIYNARTGEFFHRKSGKPAGSLNHDGYPVVKVEHDGRRIQIAIHKAAFAIYHGRYPEGELDHRDTKRTNIRIRNLREATRVQNMANVRRKGKLPKGVTLSGGVSNPYRAQIRIEGRQVYLGRFPDKKQAHAAYVAKAIEIHGEFARAR